MSKLIVRGGLPGKIRLELEGGDGVDVSDHLNGYQTLHEVLPFLQALADSVPTLPPVDPLPKFGAAHASDMDNAVDMSKSRKSARPSGKP
ncbi:MAG: hypothetical protein NVS2B6_17210 [Thermoleophilaceae bacterium]